MGRVKILRNGVAASAGQKYTESRLAGLGQRGQVNGWSRSASMRNERFLQSIDFDNIKASDCVAFTLTLKVAPETPEEFHYIKNKLLKWADRNGWSLNHWVIEWATRSRYENGSPVPHLHVVLWNTDGALFTNAGQMFEAAFIAEWLRLTEHLGSGKRGQHWARITDILGWSKYVAKHSARSNSHAQRAKILPEKWVKAGRMWGHSRGFPVKQFDAEICDAVFHALRRNVLRYLRAQIDLSLLRTSDPKKRKFLLRRKCYLRTVLKKPQEISEKLGLAQWVDFDVTFRLLAWCQDRAIDQWEMG